MDTNQFNPTHEEFFNVMNQMYPEQTARVYAEIRSAKMEAYISQQNGEAEDPEETVARVAKKATKKKASK